MDGGAEGYDGMIRRTIPRYDEMMEAAAAQVPGSPRIWLDAGCGIGTFAKLVLAGRPSAQLVLADPSEDMIAAAKAAMRGDPRCLYVARPAHLLNFGDGTLDAATALLSLHYYDAPGRRSALANLRRMLRPGGVLVYVEHADAAEASEAEWRRFLTANGRTEEEADRYLARRGREFFPVPEAEHLRLLEGCGFEGARVFWRTCADIGLAARRPRYA